MDAQIIVLVAGLVLLLVIIASLIFLRGYSGKYTYDTANGTRPRASEGEGNTLGVTFKGRFRFLMAGVGAMFAALTAKLWSMQMVSSDYYDTLSQQNQTRTVRTSAPRGRILDRNGNVLENESTLNQDKNKTQVMSEKEAYEMTYMLEGVIDHGTGTGAAIGRPAAGKTGTTDNNVDAWFVGYTPTIVTAVWIGDDSGSHSLGEVYGGTIPAAIWRDYMTVATQDESYEGFSIPAGMEPIAPPPKEEPKPKADAKKDAAKDKGKKSRESAAAQKDESSDDGERAAEERAVQQAARNNKEE